jgi:plasmid stabilization system protein ParE
MRVEWSNSARDDLDDLVRYISKDSTFYARHFGEKIVLATRQLQDFPEGGRTIPEVDDQTLREIIVRGYRVMYRLEVNRVLILAIMHGSRDLTGQEKKFWKGNE